MNENCLTFAFKLVILVFFYDFLLSLAFFCPLIYYFADSDAYIGDVICNIQGAVKVLAINGSFCGTLSISLTIYNFFVRRKPLNMKNPILYYYPLTILFPLVSAIIPIITQNITHVQPIYEISCYMSVKEYDDGSKDVIGIIEKFAFSFIPYIVTVLLEIYFISSVLYFFWKNEEARPKFVDIRKLLAFPILLLLLWCWIIAERFYELISGGQVVTWLNQFDIQVGLLNGFMNSLIYGFIPFNICQKKNKNSISKSAFDEASNDSFNSAEKAQLDQKLIGETSIDFNSYSDEFSIKSSQQKNQNKKSDYL
ncbi:hypothetical protein ABPG74_001920 [Tetrahymena malaccensis]